MGSGSGDMEPPNVVKGTLSLLATADGGRAGPLRSGYRGGLFFDERDDDGLEIHYDAITVLDDVESVAPGDACAVTIHLVSPELFPRDRIAAGETFEVKEGHRVVGRVAIHEMARDHRSFRARGLP
jgi:translation elongation factor EF-Tu-like GTPase